MRRVLYLLFLLVVCTNAKGLILIDDEIPAKISSGVYPINQAVISALYKQDIEKLQQHYSDSAKNPFSMSTITLSKEYLRQFGALMQNDSPVIEHSFYTETSLDETVLFKATKAPAYYSIKTKSFNDETFFIVNLVAQKRGDIQKKGMGEWQDTLLVLTNYSKTNGEWKLDQLRISDLTHKGVRAQGYYERALKKIDNQKCISAMDDLKGHYYSSMPFNDLWSWNDSAAADSLSTVVHDQFSKNVTIPLSVTTLKTTPLINLYYNDQGPELEFIPTIVYTTTIDPKDSLAIQKENIHLHQVIDSLLGEEISKTYRIQYEVYSKDGYEKSRLPGSDRKSLLVYHKIWQENSSK